jgi:hypothetical protein
MKANPYPLGINWGSALEVAFRSLSWIWVDQMLSDAPGYTELRAKLLPALAFHGRYIERYLSTYFSPNTHLLGEAVALFFLGTLYPQIAAASRWQQIGWKIVLQAAQRQVRPDGVYLEQSLHYHVYALTSYFIHGCWLRGTDWKSRRSMTLRWAECFLGRRRSRRPDRRKVSGTMMAAGSSQPAAHRTEHMVDRPAGRRNRCSMAVRIFGGSPD